MVVVVVAADIFPLISTYEHDMRLRLLRTEMNSEILRTLNPLAAADFFFPVGRLIERLELFSIFNEATLSILSIEIDENSGAVATWPYNRNEIPRTHLKYFH